MARARASRQMPAVRTQFRCAIYTRKSTEDGLEQEFNSLDAQREACAAYILSQRHEGWTLLPGCYDDGGFSGGSMERPGLKELLAEVEAGRVDVIVVYKVDRLTRSLSDFARIVEVLDNADASFVSITQAFNTTSSMGRLTLNVLLSFAQFEREVTGERIRDKVAASKKKGMWMGGNVPLGYDVVERKLIINPTEAEQVRHMFARYIALGTIVALQDELKRQQIRSKAWVARSGRAVGGMDFTAGALAHLLQNRTYVGLVHHQGDYYPGEHPPIVDAALFKEAQALLDANRAKRAVGTNLDDPSLLAGLLHDMHGRRMKATHAKKSVRRYRYYISFKDDTPSDQPICRIPAGEIEAAMLSMLHGCIADPDLLHRLINRGVTDDISIRHLQRSLALMAATLNGGTPVEQRKLILQLVAKAQVFEDRIDLELNLDALRHDIAGADDSTVVGEPQLLRLSAPAQLLRAGKGNRLIIPPSHRVDDTHADASLIGFVVRALMARKALADHPELGIDAVAAGQGLNRDYFRVLLRLSFLSPDIVAAILEGRQPRALTRQKLARFADLPLRWEDQRRVLGFAAPLKAAA